MTIIRLWSTRFGRAKLFGRGIDYLTFYLSAGLAVLRYAGRGDVVVTKTDPPMLAVVTGTMARLKGAVPVNWLQDLFPEVAEIVGPGRGALSRLAYGTMRLLRNASLRAARMTVVIGHRMYDRVLALGIPADRIRVIANWADEDTIRPIAASANPLRARWGLEDAFVVGYSGNLGRAHDHDTLAAAIVAVAAARPRRRIVWLFIGGGAGAEELKAAANADQMASVIFQPYQPRDHLALSLGVADVHLVTLRPDLEGCIVPSKAYGIAAAGRAQIFIGDPQGEVAAMLARSGAGMTVAQGDSDALAAAILDLHNDDARCRAMGQRARATFEQLHTKATAVIAWEKVLSEVRPARA